MAAARALHPTDGELMLRVQDGDAEAFGCLHRRLAPGALRVACSMLGGDEDRSQDAVQEAFLSFWRSRGLYRPELGDVDSWAHAIVRNRVRDGWRRHEVQARLSNRLADVAEDVETLVDVQDDCLSRCDAQQLHALLWELPATQREAIALSFFVGLTHREIAERLAVPLGTVKGRLRLGYDKLHGELAAVV